MISGACERKVYGKFDVDKLGSLCDKDDPIACLRFATRVKDPKKVETKLGALFFCSVHEMMHAGQIGLLRRLLGKSPLR